MMVKEMDLVESIRDLNLGLTFTARSIRLNRIEVMSDFKGQIAQAQEEYEEF